MCCSRCSWMENPNNQSSRTAKICSLETQIIANETWKYWMPNGRCFLSPLKFTFKPFVYFKICFVQMLNRSFELCLKTYGEKHMLTLRLYLNIGILYEDNRDFQKAYDYFVKWHETCQEVRESLKWHLIRSEMKGTVALACLSVQLIKQSVTVNGAIVAAVRKWGRLVSSRTLCDPTQTSLFFSLRLQYHAVFCRATFYWLN